MPCLQMKGCDWLQCNNNNLTLYPTIAVRTFVSPQFAFGGEADVLFVSVCELLYEQDVSCRALMLGAGQQHLSLSSACLTLFFHCLNLLLPRYLLKLLCMHDYCSLFSCFIAWLYPHYVHSSWWQPDFFFTHSVPRVVQFMIYYCCMVS